MSVVYLYAEQIKFQLIPHQPTTSAPRPRRGLQKLNIVTRKFTTTLWRRAYPLSIECAFVHASQV